MCLLTSALQAVNPSPAQDIEPSVSFLTPGEWPLRPLDLSWHEAAKLPPADRVRRVLGCVARKGELLLDLESDPFKITGLKPFSSPAKELAEKEFAGLPWIHMGDSEKVYLLSTADLELDPKALPEGFTTLGKPESLKVHGILFGEGGRLERILRADMSPGRYPLIRNLFRRPGEPAEPAKPEAPDIQKTPGVEPGEVSDTFPEIIQEPQPESGQVKIVREDILTPAQAAAEAGQGQHVREDSLAVAQAAVPDQIIAPGAPAPLARQVDFRERYPVYKAARLYLDMGFSIILLLGKKPLGYWTEYQSRQMTLPELRKMWDRGAGENICEKFYKVDAEGRHIKVKGKPVLDHKELRVPASPYNVQVALVTGAASWGLVAFDADTPAAFEELRSRFDTPVWQTTRQGGHLFGIMPDGWVIGPHVKIGGNDWDIRHEGGLIIVAPSPCYDKDNWRYTGQLYQWHGKPWTGIVPWTRAALPGYPESDVLGVSGLRKDPGKPGGLLAPRSARRSPAGLPGKPSTMKASGSHVPAEGSWKETDDALYMDSSGVDPYAPRIFDDKGVAWPGRNDTAFRIACREISMGIPIRDIRTRGREWAWTCEPPLVLPDDDIDEVIDNAIKKALRNGDENAIWLLEQDPEEMRKFAHLYHATLMARPASGEARPDGHSRTDPDATGLSERAGSGSGSASIFRKRPAPPSDWHGRFAGTNARSRDEYRRVNAGLLAARLPDILFPPADYPRGSGGVIIAGDIHGTPGNGPGGVSFRLNPRTGKWADHATGERGRDLVSLWAKREGIGNGKALLAAKRWLGSPERTALRTWLSTRGAWR
ncbi:MAG: bifunctional DNA primase/polymerase [Deltaproteobacteria bacterium]|nr:bifunctional DNA primase/polymerase [Deltaproteobacteria bacterium]